MSSKPIFVAQVYVQHFGPIVRYFEYNPSKQDMIDAVNEFFKTDSGGRFQELSLAEVEKGNFHANENALFSN